MGKKSRRKTGARRYADYDVETLKLAVDLVKSKALTSYEAERHFGIPRRTILNHARNIHEKAVGRPTVLSVEDETHIADVLELTGRFGCPLSMLDLRIVVHNYIQKSGRNHLFNGKMPGERWVRDFLERHKFSLRATQNIKRSRAAKSIDEIFTYFDHLQTSIKDIPSQNILNFDETNLSDDPGSSKAAFKRGTKHPERVLNSSKTCISIMFSITADGECLPPYVVYKAEHLWSQWCKNGPPNARYNRTKSGWFDMVCFDDWFKTIVLPWANSREGPKVIIGDNLSSHLSAEVIQLCGESNINLVFLPPNSTHLTQPLDVAFFGPMKRSWRKILLDYKTANKNVSTLNKTHFPELLKQLLVDINMSSSKTICSGFAACGIFPHDPTRVIGKIPTTTVEQTKQFDVCLLQYLEHNRTPIPQTKTKTNKKLSVVPGKSVSTEDFNQFIKGKGKKTVKDKYQISLEPKSLKSLCTDFVNKLIFGEVSDRPTKSRKRTSKKTTLKSVRLLGHASHHADKENTPFTAVNDRDLPQCLQMQEIINADNCEAPKPKITILQDVKVTPPGPSGIKSKGVKNQKARSKNIKPKISTGFAALNTKIIPTNKVKKLQSIKRRVQKETKREDHKRNALTKNRKRLAVRHSTSSTSISDDMSVHSDSSIMNISNDIDSDEDLPLSRVANLLSPNIDINKATNISDTPTLKNDDDHISFPCETNSEYLSLFGHNDPELRRTYTSTNTSDMPNSEGLCNALSAINNCPELEYTKRSLDDSRSPIKSCYSSGKTNDEISQCEPTSPQEQKEAQLVSLIEPNDKVLVRYYNRNSWKYYIGVVTTSINDDTFEISFYTTMRSKGELKFKKPRRLDRDIVPRESIIKIIELSKTSDKPEVFHLLNEDDAIYF